MSEIEPNQSNSSDAEFVKRMIGFSLIGLGSVIAAATGLSLVTGDETASGSEYSASDTAVSTTDYNNEAPSPLAPVAFSLAFGAIGTHLAFPRKQPKKPRAKTKIDPAIRHLDFETPNVEPFYDAD